MATQKKQITHTFTQEYLDANPELVAAGYVAGDKVKVWVSKKEVGLNDEETAAELKAALLAAKAGGTPDEDEDEQDVPVHPGLEELTKYFEGNAAGSSDRNKSIDDSAKWLKGDIMGTVRHMGGNGTTKTLFTLFATDLCNAVDELAEKLKEKK